MGKGSIGILIYCAVLVLVVIGLVVYMLLRKRKHKDEMAIRKVKDRNGGKNYLKWIYDIYANTPFLDKYFIKIRTRIALIYPADGHTVNTITSKILAKGTFIGIACAVFITVTSGGNLFFFLAGLLFSYVVITEVVTNSVNKMELRLKKQMLDAVNKVRHYYHDSHVVETAIQLAIDDLPYEIGLHLETVYDIITSANAELETDKYVDSCPDKMFLTFLTICSSIKEAGDKELENGESLFLHSLEQLTTDISDEIISDRMNRDAFGILTWLTILPVAFLKPIEAWVQTNLEEMADIYNGIYGMVTMLVIFFSCFLCHSLVISLRDKEREITKDSSIFARIADIPQVSDDLTKIIQRKYAKYNHYDKEMKAMGDYTGPKAFLLKRISFGIIGFAVTLLVLFGAEVSQGYAVLHAFENEFVNTLVPSEEYRDTMRDAASDYARMFRHKDVTEQELQKIIETEMGLQAPYAESIATTVLAHLNKYNNTYFKWWYLMIAFAVAVGGYMLPVFMLRFKHSIIDIRRQEEVLQFQNLMLILMYMDGITLNEILEWMERFSYCFREEIVNCRLAIYGGQEAALMDMQALVDYEPMVNFIDNLKAIDRVGVEDAFAELKQQREYIRKMNELEIKKSIKKKSGKASFIAVLPVLETAALYLIVPMFQYAMSMFAEFQSIM